MAWAVVTTRTASCRLLSRKNWIVRNRISFGDNEGYCADVGDRLAGEEATMRRFDLMTCAILLCLGVLGPGSAGGQSPLGLQKPAHCVQFPINDKASTPLP